MVLPQTKYWYLTMQCLKSFSAQNRHPVSFSFPLFSSTDQMSKVSVRQTEQRKCLQAVVVEAPVTIKQAALTTQSTSCVQVWHQVDTDNQNVWIVLNRNVAHLANQSQKPSVPLQVPIYPWVDRSNNSPVSRSAIQVSWLGLKPRSAEQKHQSLSSVLISARPRHF